MIDDTDTLTTPDTRCDEWEEWRTAEEQADADYFAAYRLRIDRTDYLPED